MREEDDKKKNHNHRRQIFQSFLRGILDRNFAHFADYKQANPKGRGNYSDHQTYGHYQSELDFVDPDRGNNRAEDGRQKEDSGAGIQEAAQDQEDSAANEEKERWIGREVHHEGL